MVAPKTAPSGAGDTDPSAVRAKPIDFRKLREQIPEAQAAPKTLGEFWSGQYRAHLEKKRPNTRKQYELRWRVWIEPAFGDLALQDVTPWMVEEWLRWLRSEARTLRWADRKKENRRPLSPGYIHQLHSSLSSLFTRAMRMHLVATNPAKQARDELPPQGPSEQNKTRPRHWTIEEARRFLTHPSVDSDVLTERATALYAMLRRGEVCGLRWACMQLDDAIPHLVIDRSYHGPTKNGKTRLVPIHRELQPILERWKSWGWRKKFGRRPELSDLVFPTIRRTMRYSIRLDYYETLACARVPLIKHHGLRHTMAQLMRDSGIATSEVAAVLGHTSQTGAPEVTKTYVRDSLPVLGSIMAKFPGILSMEANSSRVRSAIERTERVDEPLPDDVHKSLPSRPSGTEKGNSHMETIPCSTSRTTGAEHNTLPTEESAPDTVREAQALPEAFAMLLGLFGDEQS